MQLKSLEIQGFKSFPDKVKMTFDRGITAVVGPNGSGKSNLVDAVRWVFGEQSTKTLRGSRMEDVIFGGTALRKAQGYAVVSLVIDNGDRTLEIDSDEVTVTRKLYRSGESEYRLCGAAVRLKDVHELFMDTGLGRDGYSIIGQGKIAEIISSKSGERREIFEEAAGISKYRYRRAEAERRLTLAEENVLRLRDILQELQERVVPLERESKRAQQFLQLSQEKRRLEISVWIADLTHSRSRLKEQQDRYLLAKGTHDRLEEQVTALEEEIARLYDQMQQYAITADGLQNKVRQWEQEQAELKSAAAVRENDIRHNQSRRGDLQLELEGFAQSGEVLSDQIAQLTEEMHSLQTQLEELGTRAAEAQAQESGGTAQLRQLSQQSDALRARRTAVYQRMDEAKLTGAASRSRLDETQERLEALRSSAAVRQEQEQQLLQEQQSCSNLLVQIDRQLEALQNTREGYLLKQQGRRHKQQELQQHRRELEQQAAQHRQKAVLLEEMERSFEGYAHSVRYILQSAQRGILKGVRGPVSGILTIAPAYTTAIEIALGGAMQNIVVEEEQHAKQAIRLLDRERKGRATFLPMNTIKGHPIDPKELVGKNGYIGIASELVQFEQPYGDIVHHLLGRIVIAADLDAAAELAKRSGYRWRIVTLDGQVVNAGGSMTGGHMAKTSGILGRRGEIEALRGESGELERQAQGVAAEEQALDAELTALEKELLALEEQARIMSGDRIRAEGEQKRVALALEQSAAARAAVQQEELLLDQRLRELHSQREDAGCTLTLLQQELEELSAALEALQQQRTQLEELQLARQEARARQELQQMAAQKDLQAAQANLQRLQEQAQSDALRRGELRNQMTQLTEEEDTIRRALAAMQLHLTELEEQTADARERIRRSAQERTRCEQDATELRAQVREQTAKKETAARELARLEERLQAQQADYDGMIHQLWDTYELTRTQAEAEADPILDLDAARRSLQTLRGQIRALGSVHVGAIEEYREVNERYTFLRDQLLDVERSQRELRRLIQELTGQMQEIFSETFARINTHFGRVFADLFGGGRASLSLTDSADVLGSGIEIHVQPPGKLIKNLAALSGGEQAFVAIAIYFAILKVNPSPFVLLDEIEAALDDVNVSKYAQYLRTLTNDTQFIAITHRRGTMEEADVLYGVTMQEEGVSKMIELRVSELESKLGMKQ